MSTSILKFIGRLAAALLLFEASTANAVIFCVESTSQFESALAKAGANGVSDRILLALPQFTAPVGSFHYSNAGTNEAVTVEGGYGPQCSTHPAGAKTVISGENVTAPGALLINAFRSQVVVQDLVFTNYDATDNFSAALRIEGDELEVLVQRTGAYFNEGPVRSAVWIVGANGAVIFRDNLIVGNRSDGAVVQLGGRDTILGQEMRTCIVTNNTHTGNSTHSANASAQFYVYGCTETVVSNNIFWGNARNDLYVEAYNSQAFALVSNDIEDLAYSVLVPPVETGTLDVDPMFAAGLFNFGLSPSSPLIDAGDSDAAYLGESDHRGATRKSGLAVDIGAIERQIEIFRDGFE